MLRFNPIPTIAAFLATLWLGYKVGQLSMVEVDDESVDPFIEDQRLAADAGLQ